ncbi:hypothetical protein ACFQU9_03160 [Actinomadura namibiensis]|uniref:Uncharacterized protein n=1 Tax=Actinomadura namibiensis TaxID=182080 RepID=A0A7W3M0W8_ACTNM|nr:hypothetical protein [Actinomadura namibiensis]MBA8957765.1 hypothetical protein [Actinomadura namibiensis]
MSRNLKVPVADTVLDCNDTEGPGQPILLLNGMYATQRYWRGLLPLLTGRHDARQGGRGAGRPRCRQSITRP